MPMTTTITVRCLCCLAEVAAVPRRAGKTPRMLRHHADGLPCPALGCEPIGRAAERARPRADLTQWGALTQRIGQPRRD
jgi:hypothetical protein